MTMKRQSIGFHLDRLRELSERANGEEYTDIGELWELTQALADATADRLGYAPVDWSKGELTNGK
jgi:hypothetical protein